jgi:hypothetical protein
MLRLPKSVLTYGGTALAAALLALAAPRAAHALAATLVQVANTSANPAVTQNVSSQVSQLVSLYGSESVGDPIGTNGYFAFVSSGTFDPYSVPPSQSLVITDIDTIPEGCTGNGIFQLNLSPSVGGNFGRNLVNLSFQGPVTPHLQYRSGIVFPPGSVPLMQLAGCQQSAIYLHGYLTSN